MWYVYMVKSILERMRLHGKAPNEEQVAYRQYVLEYLQQACSKIEAMSLSNSVVLRFIIFVSIWSVQFCLILCMTLVGTIIPSSLAAQAFERLAGFQHDINAAMPRDYSFHANS